MDKEREKSIFSFPKISHSCWHPELNNNSLPHQWLRAKNWSRLVVCICHSVHLLVSSLLAAPYAQAQNLVEGLILTIPGLRRKVKVIEQRSRLIDWKTWFSGGSPCLHVGLLSHVIWSQVMTRDVMAWHYLGFWGMNTDKEGTMWEEPPMLRHFHFYMFLFSSLFLLSTLFCWRIGSGVLETPHSWHVTISWHVMLRDVSWEIDTVI